MPNVRGKDQKGVLVMMRESFLKEIDAALPKAGFSDRSKFIREAIYQRLRSLGFGIDPVESTAPSRKGKGGRPSHYKKYPVARFLAVADAPAPPIEQQRIKDLRYDKKNRPKKDKP